MQHKDKIIIQKILSEIDIGIGMMGKEELDPFLAGKKHYRRNAQRISAGAVESYRRNEGYCGAQVSDTADGGCVLHGSERSSGFEGTIKRDSI